MIWGYGMPTRFRNRERVLFNIEVYEEKHFFEGKKHFHSSTLAETHS